ncbi:MAG: uracil phosphoribosyltransferase [bacterium]
MSQSIRKFQKPAEAVKVFRGHLEGQKAIRLQDAYRNTPRSKLDQELRRIRQAIADDRKLSFEERGDKVVTPLSGQDRGLLERAMLGYQTEGRLKSLENVPDVQELLDVLRINHFLSGLTSKPEAVVSGAEFRAATHELFRAVMPHFREFATKREGNNWANLNVGAALMLRAALGSAIPLWESGIRNIGLLGIGRDEKTAKPDIFYWERKLKDPGNLDRVGLFEPMNASGGSLGRGVQWTVDQGVPDEKIVAVTVISVPQAIDELLMRFPGLRILTVAIDGGLNAKAFIEDMGIGDFGDQYMQDLGVEEALKLWVETEPGVLPMRKDGDVWVHDASLTEEEVHVIMKRTAQIAAAHHAPEASSLNGGSQIAPST